MLLLDFYYEGQFEIQQVIENLMYSANLKRECLRETEDFLIKKYSRKTEKEIVVFGLITQSPETEIEENNENQHNDEKSLKLAVMQMIETLTNVEDTFVGKLNKEVIIDPIAVYTDL